MNSTARNLAAPGTAIILIGAVTACGSPPTSAPASPTTSAAPVTVRSIPLTPPGTVLTVGRPAGVDAILDGRTVRVELTVTSIDRAAPGDFAGVKNAPTSTAGIYYIRASATPADSRDAEWVRRNVMPSFTGTTSTGADTDFVQVLGVFKPCPIVTDTPAGQNSCHTVGVSDPSQTIVSVKLIGLTNTSDRSTIPKVSWSR